MSVSATGNHVEEEDVFDPAVSLDPLLRHNHFVSTRDTDADTVSVSARFT